MSPLRLAFMGTPDFAVPALAALILAGHAVAAVYTQPARPAERSRHLRPSPIAHYAETHQLALRTPASLRDPEEQRHFAALGLDGAVVAAYGLLLPREILAAPRLGCLNIHASLLPRWRGAAPIERAILAGDAETGVCIMQMDEGLDTGGVLMRESLAIGPEMNAGALREALARLGARLVVAALDGRAKGHLAAVAQPTHGISYARKISKVETRLDWHRPAEDVVRQVRAFSPTPGAWFELAGDRVRVLAAIAVPGTSPAVPGTVLDGRLTVACGTGAVRACELQRAGGRALAAEAFLRGRPVPVGTRFV
ncbi:MAG: methionyl-tRNA formyltransferase [Alphaproteobacteria bacterium]